METINIHKAKTHLSRLVEEAAQGEIVYYRESRETHGEGVSAFRRRPERIAKDRIYGGRDFCTR